MLPTAAEQAISRLIGIQTLCHEQTHKPYTPAITSACMTFPLAIFVAGGMAYSNAARNAAGLEVSNVASSAAVIPVKALDLSEKSSAARRCQWAER